MSGHLAGGCACGAARYELTSPPIYVHCCHCRSCQRETGTAFAVNALIETDRIILSGKPPVAGTLPTDSGRPHVVYRCPDCLTVLWSDYGKRGYLSFLRGGTLDDPAAITPDVHVFTRSKLPWVSLPSGVPAFAEFYPDMKAQWPAEALARRQAASDKAKREARGQGTPP